MLVSGCGKDSNSRPSPAGPTTRVIYDSVPEDSASGLPVAAMQIGNQTFHLEVADSAASMERGLMDRDAMGKTHGMIFVFPRDDYREFWMKNTRIPLDIIFVNSAGTVVSIRQMEPFDLTVHGKLWPGAVRD